MTVTRTYEDVTDARYHGRFFPLILEQITAFCDNLELSLISAPFVDRQLKHRLVQHANTDEYHFEVGDSSNPRGNSAGMQIHHRLGLGYYVFMRFDFPENQVALKRLMEIRTGAKFREHNTTPQGIQQPGRVSFNEKAPHLFEISFEDLVRFYYDSLR